MSEIAQGLKIEGPGAGQRMEDTGIMVEYMGLRVILYARRAIPGDHAVCLVVQTGDGQEDVTEYPAGLGGVTAMPITVDA